MFCLLHGNKEPDEYDATNKQTMAKQVFIRRRWNGADTPCQTALRSQPKQVANETGKPLILLFSLNQLVFTRILVLPPNYLVEKLALKRRTNGPL